MTKENMVIRRSVYSQKHSEQKTSFSAIHAVDCIREIAKGHGFLIIGIVRRCGLPEDEFLEDGLELFDVLKDNNQVIVNKKSYASRFSSLSVESENVFDQDFWVPLLLLM